MRVLVFLLIIATSLKGLSQDLTPYIYVPSARETIERLETERKIRELKDKQKRNEDSISQLNQLSPNLQDLYEDKKLIEPDEEMHSNELSSPNQTTQNTTPLDLSYQSNPSDKIDVEKYSSSFRVFDESLLLVKDENGKVTFSFVNSPCFSELGYNPEFTQAQNLANYKSCEASKRSKAIIEAMPFVVGLAAFILIIWLIVYLSNSNKRKWIEVTNRYDIDKDYKQIIDEFFIPDNISFDMYHLNTRAEKKTMRQLEQVVPCTYSFRKYIIDENYIDKNKYPEWFISAYPDVAVWHSKNSLGSNSRRSFKSKESKSELRKMVNHFVNEFGKLELKN